MIEDFDGWKMWWMILWADVDMRDGGGFVLVSRYQVTIEPVVSFSYFPPMMVDGPTFIRKQVANTGQLRRRLYHIPISFVRDWADGLEARIGDRMIGKSERSINESRLMRLLVSKVYAVLPMWTGERTLISAPGSSVPDHYLSAHARGS
jgi:hypothetical protein